MTTRPMTPAPSSNASPLAAQARERLGRRNLVFVGLMGAGKSAIGRLVAQQLQLPFVDSDTEIERVSRMTISELFAAYGEPEFRALEARVVKRLLRAGPKIVSTGGGAFIHDATRQQIALGGLSIWLKADLETLWERVNKRENRPLLKTENPRQTLETLMQRRYPIYQLADITILSRDVGKDEIVEDVLRAIVAQGSRDAPQAEPPAPNPDAILSQGQP